MKSNNSRVLVLTAISLIGKVIVLWNGVFKISQYTLACESTNNSSMSLHKIITENVARHCTCSNILRFRVMQAY